MTIKKIIILIIIFLLPINKIESFENKIILFVNNEVITTLDIYNEIEYLKILNPEFNNLNKLNSIEVAKNSLIAEIIKKNEILKYTEDLNIEDVYIENSIKKIYNNIGYQNINDFIIYLDGLNVDLSSIKKKISLEIIWKELVYSKFFNQIVVDKEKIRNELQNNQNKISEMYFLSELIFNAQNLDDKNFKFKKIESDINKIGFKNAVLLHSIANSAQNSSGEIGWVNKASLNPNIQNEIDKLNIGEYSTPIAIPGGFLILKIDDVKKVEPQKIDIDNQVNQIFADKTNEQLNNFSNIYFNKIKKEFVINEK